MKDGGAASWERVRARIGDFVEKLTLKVVNSDEDVGTDLDFSPRVRLDGSVAPPSDIFTIIIGGAKLSRGLTIEGLGITYFTRWVPNPTEDTVLQLSRWYGYRGPFLEFCRVMTTEDIYRHLWSMNENDADLRLQLAGLMKGRKKPSDAAPRDLLESTIASYGEDWRGPCL